MNTIQKCLVFFTFLIFSLESHAQIADAKLKLEFNKLVDFDRVEDLRQALEKLPQLRTMGSSDGSMRMLTEALLKSVSNRKTSLELVTLLVENGADPTWTKVTPARKMYGFDYPESTDSLINKLVMGLRTATEASDTTNAQLIDLGYYPRERTKSHERLVILKYLIDQGADPTTLNTGVMSMLLREDLESSKQLLELGVNPNVKDVSGFTLIENYRRSIDALKETRALLESSAA